MPPDILLVNPLQLLLIHALFLSSNGIVQDKGL
jgi:hypothetical protein